MRNFSLIATRTALEEVLLEIAKHILVKVIENHDVTYAMGVISPQISHMWTLKASETSKSLSLRKALAP